MAHYFARPCSFHQTLKNYRYDLSIRIFGSVVSPVFQDEFRQLLG